MAEEEQCVKVIAASLAQTSDQLNGVAGLVDPKAPKTVISIPEATEFVEMLSRIISSNHDDSERLRYLIFEIDSKLLEALVSILETPQLTAEGDPLALLFVQICKCLGGMINTCMTPAPANSDAEQPNASEQYLTALINERLLELQAGRILCRMLVPALPPDVNYAACDCLYALLVRSEGTRRVLCQPETGTADALVVALSSNSESALRCCVVACLRELSTPDGAKIATAEMERVLVRVLALDSNDDVRSLCAETLDTVYKNDPTAWGSSTVRKELATACVDRLERDKSLEVLETVLKLVETLITADMTVPDSSMDSNTFTETFVALTGERCLVQCTTLGGRVATLAARGLRLLAQLAPFYRYVSYNAFSHFPTLSTMLKVLIDLNRPEADRQYTEKGGDPILRQVLKVELAIAFCVMLAVDPRCRQLLSSQLHDHSAWAQQLRAAILSHLNAAALEYFGDVILQDCTGEVINSTDQVIWETDLRPTRTSVEETFEKQEDRWGSMAEGDVPESGRPKPTRRDEGEEHARSMRLTFILLSYAAHCTLQDVTGDKTSPARETSAPAVQQTAAQSQGRSPDDRQGPLPTRTSILREWGSKPERFSALQRSAARGVQGGEEHRDPYEESLQQRKVTSQEGQKTRRKTALFSKFDAALALCTSFAQYYNNVGDPQPVIYEATADGFFARRQPRKAAWYGTARAMKTKTWTLDTLREGDLFFFSIPLPALNSFALEQIRNRAVKHLQHVKKSFIITPQAAKDRRWFLFDMLNHIMPGVIHAVTQLLELFHSYGDENAKFPIVMFREKEAEEQGGPLHELQDTLHSGNLLEVIDQTSYYFQNIDQKKAQAAGGAAMSSQYLRDLEFKIKSLSNQEFTGNETAVNSLMMGGVEVGSDHDERDSVVSAAEPTGLRGARAGLFRDDVSDVSSIV